jgi:hypothetical protein
LATLDLNLINIKNATVPHSIHKIKIANIFHTTPKRDDASSQEANQKKQHENEILF